MNKEECTSWGRALFNSVYYCAFTFEVRNSFSDVLMWWIVSRRTSGTHVINCQIDVDTLKDFDIRTEAMGLKC